MAFNTRSMSAWIPLRWILLVIAWLQVDSLPQEPRAYCEAETFRATCSPDQVVIMTRAEYGRMEVGRCVQKDYGYVGCLADVTEHMDNTCSGRRTCEIRIPDSALDRVNPCPGDFKTYLNAGYTCIPVHNPPCRPCRNYTEILTMSTEGYLASIVTEETGCGSGSCPYVVRASPGQRLNLTLMDFAMSSRRSSVMSNSLGLPDVCYRYAEIHERVQQEGKWKEREQVICGGQERERHVFISQTNAVTINMVGRSSGGSMGQFLIKYQVLGCAEYDAPRNSWVKRDGDVMDVGCVSTGEKWQLICEDSVWTGQVGLCPAAPPESSAVRSSHILSIPMGILIAVILAIAMIIGVFILTAGLIVIKRRRMRNAALRAEESLRQDQYMKGHYGGPIDVKEYAKGHETIGRYQYPPAGVLNGYPRNRNMEMRPLPSIPDEAAEIPNGKRTSDVSDVMIRSGEFPNVHAAPFNPRQSDYSKGSNRDDGSVSRQYFVLDPEMGDAMISDELGDMHDLRYVPGNPHKSPEQENQENFVKDLCPPNTSCHHIPSCFPHANMNEYKETGNCSWP